VTVITLPRNKGKTTELVKLAAEKWLYIVSIDRRSVENTAKIARELGLDIPFPITFEEFMQGRFHPSGIRGFLIDDVDMLLEYQARGVPIHAVTITAGETA
jgi:hypothetical protein